MRNLGLGLGLTNIYGGGGSVDPDAAMAALLADGAHMALDTGRMSDFWQVTGAVNPVTAGGQFVGWAQSRFGTTTYNFSNGSAGTLPAYQTDGYLLFVRASAQLLFGAANIFPITNAAPALFSSCSFWANSIPGVSVLIGASSATTTTNRFNMQLNADGSVTLNARRQQVDANATATSAAGIVAPGGYYTISGQVIPSTGEMKVWVNGVEVATGTLATTGATFEATDSGRFRLGAQVSATSQYFDGYIRRPVLLRKALTDAERAIVEEWVAGIRTYAGGYIVAGGIDTWFNSPEMDKKGNKVYFGTVDDGVGLFLNEWDLANNKARIVHKSDPAGVSNLDDHSAGGTKVLADGNILWMPVDHNGPNVRAVLGLPGGFTDVNIQSQIGQDDYSYTQIVQLDGETDDPIYVFVRIPSGGDERDQWMTVSTDGGESWPALVQQFGNPTADRPYPQFFKMSSTRIGCLISDAHPQEAAFNTSIHFGYYEGGQWYEGDGTSMGAVPVDVTDFTLIFDGPANDPSWTWDARQYGAESVGLFSSFPTYDAHRYHRTVIQSDGSFANEVIYDDAGYSLYGASPNSQHAYSGGMVLHPTNKDIVYACISKPAVQSGKHQLYRLDRVSAGVWDETQLTDTNDEWFRPNVVNGALTCRYGPYSSYTSFVGCRTWGMLI
jgi:hypothetical protein